MPRLFRNCFFVVDLVAVSQTRVYLDFSLFDDARDAVKVINFTENGRALGAEVYRNKHVHPENEADPRIFYTLIIEQLMQLCSAKY